MDWNKLSSQQLTEFLRLYKVTPQPSNLPVEAKQLFNQVISQFGNRAVFTEPVIDLYLASNFKGSIPQRYTAQAIRSLSPEQLQQFATAFGLPNINAERLIRILGFLNALDLSSPMGEMPTDIDYLLALNLDYFSLIDFCRTSSKLARICQDSNFWRMKAERDFNIDPLFFNVQNWKDEYIRLAAERGSPIPGVEKYIHVPALRPKLVEAAFKTGNQQLINYFLGFASNNLLSYLAGKYANRDLINKVINYQPRQSNINKVFEGAAAGGHTDIMNDMIQLGANDFENALVAAAGGGHLDIVNDMLSRTETSNIYSFSFNNAMIEAARGGYLPVIQRLRLRRFVQYNLDKKWLQQLKMDIWMLFRKQ